jgi:hypothetical protein
MDEIERDFDDLLVKLGLLPQSQRTIELIKEVLSRAEKPLSNVDLLGIPIVRAECHQRWPSDAKNEYALRTRVSNLLGNLWRAGTLERRKSEESHIKGAPKFVYCLPSKTPEAKELLKRKRKDPQTLARNGMKITGTPKRLTMHFSNMTITIDMRKHKWTDIADDEPDDGDNEDDDE